MFEFACYLAASYLKNGDRVVFVETDPSPERVRRQLRKFGVAAMGFELDGQLAIVDCSPPGWEEEAPLGTKRVRERSDLDTMSSRVAEAIRNVGGSPVRVLFDSLTPLYEANGADEIYDFFGKLCGASRKGGSLTASVQRGMIHKDQVDRLCDLTDGVVEMVINKQFKRFIRILRMKGMDIKPRWVQFEFEKSEEDEGTMLGWGKEE